MAIQKKSLTGKAASTTAVKPKTSATAPKSGKLETTRKVPNMETTKGMKQF